MKDLISANLWAILPILLGFICLFGAITGEIAGKRKRTIILAVGGLALTVVGWTMWVAL